MAKIREINDMLRNKKISAKELTEMYLSRIDALNPQLNAYTSVTAEEARMTADIIDRKIESGVEISSLSGIPMTLKDNICSDGQLTTCCSKILEGFRPYYNATVWDWTLAIMGEKVTLTADDKSTIEYSCGTADKKPEERLNILAALEGAVLQTYDMIPIMDDASAALKGMQIKYYTEEYIYGVGRGGIKYMQYYYSDAEWDAFVAEQGGTLNYK